MTTPWPGLLEDLEALAARYLAAVDEVDSADRGTAEVERAEAVASVLVVLAEAAHRAGSRLELRTLVHSAVERLVEDELRDRVESHPRNQSG
ncbi:MAG TPA: hypothetical protein VE987_21090, partial [Polyangiaceae bacterium]|nr:hypothetical protein [Polyangiaceae bacterium]